MAEKTEKTTYASMAMTPEDHAAYEEALRNFALGERHPIYVTGNPRYEGTDILEDRDPADTSQVVTEFPQATADDVDLAFRTAKRTMRHLKELGWERRFEIVQRAKKLILQRKAELAATLTLETGKVRGEAMPEVMEVPAMIEAYEEFLTRENFYRHEMNDGTTPPYEQSMITLEPLDGPVGVIVPFNFPFALCANMAMSAFLAGNPVVIKPGSDTPLASLQWRNIMVEAGAPEESHLFLVLPDTDARDRIYMNSDVRGVAFTGSRDVGLHINRVCTQRAEQEHINIRFVAEMGGKNPTIVTRHADMEKAAMGIIRSTVGFSGQKCSANSRIYVAREAMADLLDALRDPRITERIIVGDPKERTTFTGPLINEKAMAKYRRVWEEVKRMGVRTIPLFNVKDSPIAELAARGYFVRPFLTIVPHEHWLSREEHFVPFTPLDTFDSLEEALEKANDTEYGLCAGMFSEDEEEIDYFLKNIKAGVVYANRRGGSTTGSWPTVQSFGGWGMSGLRGFNAFGPWYLTSFAREQCRTRVLR